MKTPEKIATIIDRYHLADLNQLHKLEAHIRRELPIREILTFTHFLHGGDFISSSGKWRRNQSGYITQTEKEDAALARLWESLVRSAHFYIGAASILQMQNAHLVGGCAFADEGDGPTLYDYTLDALVRAVPNEYRKQLDAASRLDTIKAQGDRIEKTTTDTKTAAAILVQHLPDAKKPPHIEEAEAVAIMRRKGGDKTDRTLRNWLKTGKAGRVKLPISWDDLASTASWSAWVDDYLGKEKIRITRKRIISEHAGETETAKARRRSPTA